MGTMANSVVTDEMPHNAAFGQGLHCLLRPIRPSVKEIQPFSKIITCDPSIYTMGHPGFFVCSFMENSKHTTC